MLDNLHASDQIVLASELRELTGAIIDLQPLRSGVLARDRNQVGGGVQPGDLRPQSRQRLSQQTRAAADIERGLSVERRSAALVALPMLVDLVADVFEP